MKEKPMTIQCQFAEPGFPHSGDLYLYDYEMVFCHACLGNHLIEEAMFFGRASEVD